MKSLLLKNATAILPDETAENVSILIENGIIVEISERELMAEKIINLNGAKVFAGFIDIHNHGAVGFDVNESSQSDLIKIGEFLAQNGVTAWLPTFVPDADEVYQKVVGEINDLMKIQNNLPVAQIIGVHYEGIFANEQMCGALRPEFFKTYREGTEFFELSRLKEGIHLTTIAPEVGYGVRLTRDLTANNWIVLIGHTKAGTQTLWRAFENGAHHITHFFNAMTGIHHRELGVAGWALTNPDVTFDIIADGIHVTPEMLKLVIKNKTPEKVLLISDSVAPTGLGDGDFRLWGENISVKDGKTQNERGSIAGSVITMLDAFRNMIRLGFTYVEVSKMASANPAKLLGIDKTHGSIEINKRADLVAFDEQGKVKFFLIAGLVCKPERGRLVRE
ncbi:MAG TPA: N-acetylglucosamine-6-phosphate deacetylase [Pyrinomonadaceae bacterium]|nr:N-acetylglucosamine-6-phosphate deacetylase [Pyrinomonadaceae bacterium]